MLTSVTIQYSKLLLLNMAHKMSAYAVNLICFRDLVHTPFYQDAPFCRGRWALKITWTLGHSSSLTAQEAKDQSNVQHTKIMLFTNMNPVDKRGLYILFKDSLLVCTTVFTFLGFVSEVIIAS